MDSSFWFGGGLLYRNWVCFIVTWSSQIDQPWNTFPDASIFPRRKHEMTVWGVL